MSGADGILPRQIPQALHGFLQRSGITAGEIGPAHTELEQGIPGKDHIAHLVADAAGGMTGGLQDGKGQLVQLDGIALMERRSYRSFWGSLGPPSMGARLRFGSPYTGSSFLTQHHRASG